MTLPITQIPGARPVVAVDPPSAASSGSIDATVADLLASESPALHRLGEHIQRDAADGRRLLELRALTDTVMAEHGGRHRRATDRGPS